MTPKQKWLKNTGIKEGDRVVILDPEAVNKWRTDNAYDELINGFTAGTIVSVCVHHYVDEVGREALEVKWANAYHNYVPFWCLTKAE